MNDESDGPIAIEWSIFGAFSHTCTKGDRITDADILSTVEMGPAAVQHGLDTPAAAAEVLLTQLLSSHRTKRFIQANKQNKAVLSPAKPFTLARKFYSSLRKYPASVCECLVYDPVCAKEDCVQSGGIQD